MGVQVMLPGCIFAVNCTSRGMGENESYTYIDEGAKFKAACQLFMIYCVQTRQRVKLRLHALRNPQSAPSSELNW